MSDIPISAAKQIADEYDWNQVIVVAWNKKTGTQHVTTYGKSKQDCKEAACGGNFVKRALGWPDELCHAEPERLSKGGGQ